MILNLEREGYMFGGLTESVGARVSVFPPKVNVMPDESGFNVYPNTKTDVTLTHHLAERLPSPYTSHCVNSWDDTPFGGGRIANKSVYTLQVAHYLSKKKFQKLTQGTVFSAMPEAVRATNVGKCLQLR